MSKSGQTFLDLSLAGYVELSDIDDFVDRWHEGDDARELREFLGFTPVEYVAWVEEPEVLPYIATARRERRDFRDLLESSFSDYRMAARSESEKKIVQLRNWLKENGKLD